MTELPDETLHRALAHLQAAEFLYETRLFPNLEYTFKHALTHEVAYGSLLLERRRTLHTRIVEALERLSTDRMAEQVERLAYHAVRGEVWEKALAYARQAGEKARERPAYREAVACFEQALVAAQHLLQQPDTLAQAIDLRMALNGVFLVLRENRRGFDYLCEAETLAQSLDDQQRLGQIYSAMTHYFWRMGDYDSALAYGQRALDLSTASADAVQQARASDIVGPVYFSLGDYRRAIDMLGQAIAIFDSALRELRDTFQLGGIAAARTRGWLVECLTELGEFAEGRAYGEEAIRMAQAANHLMGATHAQHKLGHLALRQGDLYHAIPMLERALAHCRAADIPLFLPTITATLGLAYALAGRVTEALPLLDQVVVEQVTTIGGGLSAITGLGEAYLLAGHVERAIHIAECALGLSRDRKERGNQAWSLWLLGAIATHHDPPDIAPATAHYQQALTLADDLGMRPLQAHCQLGLGSLYATTGQREQARTALATAIALYRTMEMTFWLPQAEAALAQVEGA